MKLNQKSAEKQSYEENVAVVKCLLGGISEISKNKYSFLEKFQAETPESFETRFNQVRFDNFVAKSFAKISGDLLKATVSWDKDLMKSYPNLESSLINMDGNGLSIENFLSNLIQSTLINGVTACLVDFNQNTDLQNTQLNANKAMPIFNLIDQSNIINYSLNNMGELSHFVISSKNFLTPQVDADFEISTQCEQNYLMYIIDRDTKQIIVRKFREDKETVEGEEDKTELTQIGEDIILTGFNKLPIELLSFNLGQEQDPFLLPPPLLAVAHGNRALFQNQAYQTTILKISRFPIFASTGVPEGPNKLDPFVWLSSENEQAKFYSVETKGAGINAGKEDIEIAKQSLETSISDFYKSGQEMSEEKTATESKINKDNDLSKLEKYVKNMEIFLNDIFNTAYAWNKPNLDRLDFKFKINLNSQGFISSENKKILIELNKTGVLSRESTLDQFVKQGVLDPAFDIDTEEEKLKTETDADLTTFNNPEDTPFE